MKITLHTAYLIGIALKGLDGLIEVVSGATLLLVTRATILHVTLWLVQGEVFERGSGDFIADHAVHAAKHLSAGTLHFASAYLLVHGAIKVGLVAGLIRGWRQAYPTALVLLTAFIGYQCFRLFRFQSPLLAVFTAIDIAIVMLIWFEWKRVARGPG